MHELLNIEEKGHFLPNLAATGDAKGDDLMG